MIFYHGFFFLWNFRGYFRNFFRNCHSIFSKDCIRNSSRFPYKGFSRKLSNPAIFLQECFQIFTNFLEKVFRHFSMYISTNRLVLVCLVLNERRFLCCVEYFLTHFLRQHVQRDPPNSFSIFSKILQNAYFNLSRVFFINTTKNFVMRFLY